MSILSGDLGSAVDVGCRIDQTGISQPAQPNKQPYDVEI